MKQLFVITSLLAVQNVFGAILITEFMPNPSGTDIDREWFEIFNSGDLAFDLSGYAVGDCINPGSTSEGEGMGLFPLGTIINPGEIFVIAVNANGFNQFYGFLPDFEFASTAATNVSSLGNNSSVPDLLQKPSWGVATANLAIANGGDDVAILAPDGTFLDGANHGTVTTFYSGAVALSDNQSYERINLADTNSVSDWVVRPSGSATPGTVVPEPSSLATLALGLVAFARRRRS